jgi:hypothetical protein
MLTIYSDRDNPRWKYITTVLLQEICGVAIVHTTSREKYLAAGSNCINYSHTRITEDELFLRPVDLLFENDIRDQKITVSIKQEIPAFFLTPESDFPFDIFAASFYLITRYEEYLPHSIDNYGRYDHTQSLAYKNDFLKKPLVNIWLKDFIKLLSVKFPSLIIPVPVFRFMPTYDIDIAYAYLGRDLYLSLLGAGRSLLQGRTDEFMERLRVLNGRKKDPFDVYEWLDALHLKYRLRPFYFFLLAGKREGFDKNIDPSNEGFKELIRYHAVGYPIGMHPSWQSGDDPALLGAEKQNLESLTQKKIICSRQHYIRFSMPDTYRLLIDHEIESDFSMGYGTVNGFRASVSSPFSWYDLEAEQATSLRIYPFCFMDANAFFEQKYTPAEAFEEIRYFHDVVKKVNGTMITIWHNTFLSDVPLYKGWKDVYEIFLNEVVYWDL